LNTNLFNRIDLAIVPLILLLILIYLFRLKKKQPANIQKYFLSAFFLRAFGTFTITAITQFVYKYGDTYPYYYNAQMLRSLFLKSPGAWWEVVWTNPQHGGPAVSAYVEMMSNTDLYAAAVYKTINYNATVCKIGSVFNMVCFDSYLGIALFFGLLSFFGCWYIFKTFVRIFPGHEKQFAILCLYLPSLWFWGSGILKDPLCVFALGLLVYNLFVKDKGLFKRCLLMLLGAFLLMNIKPYIFYSFCVAAIVGAGIYYFRRFGILGKLSTISVFIAAAVLSYSAVSNLVTDSLVDLLKESQDYIKNYNKLSEEGTGTVIPKVDATPAGLVKLGAQGLVTVYTRPFPWEMNNVLYIFLVLENLLLWYIIFKKIKTGPLSYGKDYLFLVNFSFVFFIFLGMIIGITAFNFGTIARYRVPALPFIFAGVFSLKLANRKRRLEAKLIK